MATIITPPPPSVGANVPDNVKAKLKAKSQEFESFYIYQMIELMSPKTDNKVMNGGPGEEIFRHNLNEQLANNISQHGGFGLSTAVYNQLLIKQSQLQSQPGAPQ